MGGKQALFCKSALFALSLLSAGCYAQAETKQETLIIGNAADPVSLNPYELATLPTYSIVKNLFEGLVYLDNKGQQHPAQAESWAVSSDGKTITFTLRQGLRWSNDDPITAHDFVYGVQYALASDNASHGAKELLKANIINADDVASGKKPASLLGVFATSDCVLTVVLEAPLPYSFGAFAGWLMKSEGLQQK